MPGPLIRGLEIDNPDDWPAVFEPEQDLHRIQIHMVDLQAVQFTQRSCCFYRRSDVSDRLALDSFLADRTGQRKLMEEGFDDIHPAIRQLSVLPYDWKIPRLWK